tara:strand:- start:125 stop:370 length:246 start_codon:yes stop_codon:yes gene_type:complete
MDDNFWVIGIVVFLFVLSIKKYTDIDKLREWIEEYLSEISPVEVIEEEEDIVALEEIRDMIADYVISNPKVFSKYKDIKDE